MECNNYDGSMFDIGQYKEETKSSCEDNPLKNQVGGNHYSSMKIQPVEYCMANNLNICESNVIKYVSRHRNKNGIEDLKKAKHFIDLLIEFEYKNENN